MKILFNTDTLQAIDTKTSVRSGIFFTAFSLLKEFEKKHEIILYADYKSWATIKHQEVFKKYQIIGPTDWMEQKLSYLYYAKVVLSPYRKNILVNLLCKSITLLGLVLDKVWMNNKTKPSQCVEADCFFSAYSVVEKEAFGGIPKFVLLHDVIPILDLGYSSASGKMGFMIQVARFLSKNDFYFANSSYTKQDFLKYFSDVLDPSKIRVTLLGASQRFYHDFDLEKNCRIREKYKIPKDKKYIFSLCTLEPRKNLLFVINGFLSMVEKEEIKDLVFVLGGGARDGFLKQMQQQTNMDSLNVIHIGYVDDEDLSNLFSHSLCSIYLSLYEGFGLPVLESMQCGCPVIASNTTSIPEVAGDAGILIDPKDSQALQEAIQKIYSCPELREELKQKGLQRAKEFSWEKCATEMLEFMEEICQKKI